MSAMTPPDINGSIVRSLTSILKTTTLIILRGTAVYLLWGWFIVPLGVIAIGIAHAFGIAILTQYLTTSVSEHYTSTKDLNDNERMMIKYMVWMRPIFIIILGYIIHLFM